MRILLLNPPAKKLHSRDYYCSTSSKADYYWPPTDLLVLSGLLKKDHKLSLLDANVLGLSFEEAEKRIKEFSPDIILFVTSTPTFKNDMSFVKKVKAGTKIKAYASGNYVYFMPKEAMKEYPELDGIIMDFTSNGVVDFFKGKKTVDMVYRDKGKTIITERSKDKTFQYPVPMHELLPINRYRLPHAKRHPVTSMLTTFGCPFNCSFCFCGKMPIKQRPTENIIEEMKHIQSLGIKEIFFRDYTLTMNKDMTKKLCREMIDNKIDLTWIAITRADCVDKELLILMKEVGCHTIQFGVESGSDRILEKYSKRINKEKIKEVYEICNKLKINTLSHFIIGLPGETKEDVEDTIKFAKEIKTDYASFNLFVPMIGTRAREEVIKNGWLKKDDISLLDSSNEELPVETPWLKNNDLIRLKKQATREFYLRPSYMFRMLYKRKSPKELKELIKNGYAVIKSAI
ncbi:MAG: B12-binding domain-containing radical SAM protein [Nanoarchaeota archaeon]